MRAIPPVPRKPIAAVDRLPSPFRLDLDPDTTCTATLHGPAPGGADGPPAELTLPRKGGTLPLFRETRPTAFRR
jgi:hypothetical protein